MKQLKRAIVEIDLESLNIGLHQIEDFLKENFTLILKSLQGKKIRLGGSFIIPGQGITGRVIDTTPALQRDEFGTGGIEDARLEKFRVIGCGYISIYVYIEFGPKVNDNPVLEELEPNRLFVRRTPAFMVWTISNRCNLFCSHCYYFPQNDQEIPHLDLEDCYRVLDAIAGTGVLTVSLSGGEPLLIKDIQSIVSYAKEKGLKIIFNSNLTLMDDAMAGFLKSQDVALVITSLESAQGEIHDRLRGEGAFAKTVQGIRHCVQNGISTGINMAVTKLNCEGLTNIVHFARELGVSFIKFEALIPRGRAVSNYESLAPSVSEYRRIAAEIDAICKEYYSRIPIIVSNVFERITEGSSNLCCPSGQLFYTITHGGDVAICPSLTRVSIEPVNVLHTSFQKYLEAESFRDQGVYDEECLACAYFEVCKGGCFSRSYFKNGKVTSRDPMCELLQTEFLIKK